MSYNLLETEALCIAKTPCSEKVSGTNHCRETVTVRKLAPQSAITCVYRAKVAQQLCNVAVTWCKSVASHSLTITLDKPSKKNHYTCKIDLKNTQFWGKKGLKSFDIDRKRVDLFWDFREVKFSSTPEPCSGFYITLVCNEEAVLLLGDMRNEAYKRTRSKPCFEEAALLCKKESVCGKRLFCTRAMLSGGQKEHDIVIENSLSGPGDPEMWISVEGTVAIRIMNLNWRFRGNETVMVNNSPIQIFWDVHDWLFNSPGSSHGLFIFKLGSIRPSCTDSSDARNCSELCCGNDNEYDEFCHFLYAWKIE